MSSEFSETSAAKRLPVEALIDAKMLCVVLFATVRSVILTIK